MKAALLNGKDASMDIDFFISIGANPDTYKKVRDYDTYHVVQFDDDTGKRFTAFWDDDENKLRIVCEDLDISQQELAQGFLNELNEKAVALDLPDICLRTMVISMEGERPILRISFFQKDNLAQ